MAAEKTQSTEFILSESPRSRSRETGTLTSGRRYDAGEVLGRSESEPYHFGALDPAATTGEQTAAGILCTAVDATDGARAGVVLVADAEVSGALLTWPAGISEADKAIATAHLAARGIVIR